MCSKVSDGLLRHAELNEREGFTTMAQHTTIAILDDLDGKKADETVTFGLDGVPYEIDLGKKNAAALRKALAEFVGAARTVTTKSPFTAKTTIRRTSVGAAGSDRKAELVAIRTWAQQSGIAVALRGRISADLEAQYQARATN